MFIRGTGPAKAGVQATSEPEICQGIFEFNYEQMRVSGCNSHYKFALIAGAKAKSVTTSRFTGQVVLRSGKQLTHIVVL